MTNKQHGYHITLYLHEGGTMSYLVFTDDDIDKLVNVDNGDYRIEPIANKESECQR